MKYSLFLVAAGVLFAGTLVRAQSGAITLEGRWPDGPCYSSFVAGSHAFVGNGCALDVLDLSTPADPKRIGRVVLPSVVRDLMVAGEYAYVADSRGGLRIVDVSLPETPNEAAWIATGGDALSVVVAGTVAYVAADTAGVIIVDISTPTHPVPVCSLNCGGYANDIAVWENTLAVAIPDSGLLFFDVSDPKYPAAITHYALPGGFIALSVELSESHAYVASYPSTGWYGKLHILDIHDLLHPIELTSRYLPGDWASSGRNVSRADSLVFVTYASDVGPGLYVAAFNTLTSLRSLGHLWTRDARSARAYGSLLYLADGSGGLKILDLSTPSAPSPVGAYRTSDRTLDVVVANQRAYLACWEDGIRTLDLSVFPPVDQGSYSRSDAIWGSAIDVQGGYAYVTSNISGCDVIDVSNPDSSIHVARLSSVIGTALRARDTLLFVADRDNGLRIASIADPLHPQWLAQGAEGDGASNLALSGSTVYLAAGSAGTRIIDVADPRSPGVIATLPTPGSSSDVAVVAGVAYVVGGGLQIFDVSDPHSPTQLFSTGIGGYASRIAVSGSFAYVLFHDGVYLFDVSNPSSPQCVDTILTGEQGRNVYVSGDYFYVAGGEAGLYVFHNGLVARIEPPRSVPNTFFLTQNYPNPFNPTTTIRYGLPHKSAVLLAVFNTLGQRVATLVRGEEEAGDHEVTFDAAGFSTGLYFCRLQAGDFVATKRLLLVK